MRLITPHHRPAPGGAALIQGLSGGSPARGMTVWTAVHPANVCNMKRAAMTTTPESVPAR